jgi:hypothetical protein
MSVARDDAMAPLSLTLAELADVVTGAVPSTSDADVDGALVELLTDVTIEGLLTVRAGGAIREGRCWLGINGGVIAIEHAEGTVVSPTSADRFAADLARLLDLGPRAQRLPSTAVRVQRRALLEATGRDGDMTVEQAARLIDTLTLEDPAERAWLEALVSPRLVHWYISVAPRGRLSDPAESRWCEVLDCGSHGMLLVWSADRAEDADVLLAAATPTDVWRVLSSLLSDDAPSEAVDAASAPPAPA